MTQRKMARVIIVGFMAAGKSSVARELARRLKDSAIDLDDSVTKIEGRTPQQLIDEEGEAYFREAETRALSAVLECGTARIIALGGGAWARPENRELIGRHSCLTVWLDAPFELCWQRAAADDARPLARDRERAHALYKARRNAYALADRCVKVHAGLSIASVAAEIESLVRLAPFGWQFEAGMDAGGEEIDG